MVRTTPSQTQPSQEEDNNTRVQSHAEEAADRADEDMEVDVAQNMSNAALCYTVRNRKNPLRSLQKLERKANDLVHLALFMESKRVLLKRDEISKKGASMCYAYCLHAHLAAVLRSNTCSFNLVLARAQDVLRETFRMELHELQVRGALEKNKEPNSKESELLKNTGVKERGACFPHPFDPTHAAHC